MKILIVDDEVVSREKLAVILAPYGECIKAANGREALRIFDRSLAAAEPFGLVTLDVEMPDMRGDEVLMEIRSIEAKHGLGIKDAVPVVMATSHSDRDTVVTTIQAGCNEYIVKPFDRDTIRRKIHKLLTFRPAGPNLDG